MPLYHPDATVEIRGVSQPFFEFHTQHSVEAPVAQASIVVPSPAASGIHDDDHVKIKARGDAGDTLKVIFEGRIRGPIERQLTESDATITLRCDGNLWRMALPAPEDMAWFGPITPRKIIRQAFAFRGITDAHVEQFVHPTTGVPILLGGVPWFDGGLILCPAGTSPLAFVERICRLFGYRVFDRPSGAPRVCRVCGPPTGTDHTLVEGEDILNVQRTTDLHEIVNWWEAQGASGSNIAGEQIQVVSRPRRGRRSRFIPNPPRYTAGTVSDSLLVTAPVAEAARIVKELDEGGVAWRVSGQITGTTTHLATLRPQEVFKVTSSHVKLAGKKFWQIGVSQDFSNDGLWTTIDGWRPTGKPARTRPERDPVTKRHLDEEEPDYESPPLEDDVPTEFDDLDPLQDPLPATYDVDPTAEEYAPLEDPDGDQALEGVGLNVPLVGPAAIEGAADLCPPPAIAPCRRCQTVTLLEPSWEEPIEEDGELVLAFTPPQDADTITVSGELLEAGGTIEIWQAGTLVGSAPLTGGDVDWTAISVPVPGSLVAGIEAQVRLLVEGGISPQCYGDADCAGDVAGAECSDGVCYCPNGITCAVDADCTGDIPSAYCHGDGICMVPCSEVP